MTCSLYRHWDGYGRLLYVGIALCPLKRMQTHSERSGWYEQLAMITIARYPNRKLAEQAERLAVIHEKPAFNKKLGPLSRGKKSVTGARQRRVIADQQSSQTGGS